MVAAPAEGRNPLHCPAVVVQVAAQVAAVEAAEGVTEDGVVSFLTPVTNISGFCEATLPTREAVIAVSGSVGTTVHKNVHAEFT